MRRAAGTGLGGRRLERFRAPMMLAAILIAGQARAEEVAPRSKSVTEALGRLSREGKSAPKIVWPQTRRVPSMISQVSVELPGETPEAQAHAFVVRYRPLIGLDAKGLRVASVRTTAERTFVRYQQVQGGLDVEGRSVVVGLVDGRVVSVVNEAARLERIERASIDETRARMLAVEAVHGPSAPIALAQVVGHALRATGETGVEIYRVAVTRRPFVEHLEVLVDAHAGRVIGVTDRSVR